MFEEEYLKICSPSGPRENWFKHSRNSKAPLFQRCFISLVRICRHRIFIYFSLLFRVPYCLLRLASALFISLWEFFKYSKCSKLQELYECSHYVLCTTRWGVLVKSICIELSSTVVKCSRHIRAVARSAIVDFKSSLSEKRTWFCHHWSLWF